MIARRRCLQLAALASWAWPAGAQQAWTTRGPRIPSVALQDHEGRFWPLDGLLRGRPAVAVSFFFTGCLTICPPQTAALLAVQAELARRSWPDPTATPLLLSISLDPLGDTPQGMRAYAERFGAVLGLDQGWLMLTGQPQSLARVWAAFEAPLTQPEDHTAVLWIGRPAGRRWTRASALAPPEVLVGLLAGEAG